MKNIKENKESIFIPNIPRLEWGKNTDISFVKSAQLAFNAIGEKFSYEYLMGISGAAFRFHFNTDWCPSAGDATTGFDVSNVLFKSLGHECELYKIDDNSFNDIRALYQKIITQINLGIPIIAINLKVCPEWGIITGYLKNQPGILCRTYFDESDEYSLAEHAPWLSFFIGEKGRPLDEDKLFKNSLKIAVLLAKTEKFGDYLSGFHAFEYWIEELKKHLASKKSKPFEQHEVNLTLFYHLLDARQAAVRYLASMNDKMKKGNLIVDNYNKEIELLKNTGKNILPSFESKPKDWTKDIINNQVDVLKKALEIEKETIDLIEKEIN
jgi:hypothetical protein